MRRHTSRPPTPEEDRRRVRDLARHDRVSAALRDAYDRAEAGGDLAATARLLAQRAALLHPLGGERFDDLDQLERFVAAHCPPGAWP